MKGINKLTVLLVIALLGWIPASLNAANASYNYGTFYEDEQVADDSSDLEDEGENFFFFDEEMFYTGNAQNFTFQNITFDNSLLFGGWEAYDFLNDGSGNGKTKVRPKYGMMSRGLGESSDDDANKGPKFGITIDQYAPMGSGLFVLGFLGGAYLLGKRKKED